MDDLGTARPAAGGGLLRTCCHDSSALVLVCPMHCVVREAPGSRDCPRSSCHACARAGNLPISSRRQRRGRPDGDGMPLTQYYTATTLDGFIADADNSLEWLFDVPRAEDGEPRWDGVHRPTWARWRWASTTYEWVLDHEDLLDASPSAGRSSTATGPCWVFTHRDLPAHPGRRHPLRPRRRRARCTPRWSRPPADAQRVGRRRRRPGRPVPRRRACSTRSVVGIAPVTLGAGAPLLPRRIEGLRLVEVRRDGQMVSLTYDVPRPG